MNDEMKPVVYSTQNSGQMDLFFSQVSDSSLGCRVFGYHHPDQAIKPDNGCHENGKMMHTEPHVMRPAYSLPPRKFAAVNRLRHTRPFSVS
jgi:hypothetical protein